MSSIAAIGILLALGASPSVDDVAASIFDVVPLRTAFAAATRKLGEGPLVQRVSGGDSAPVARCYFGGPGSDRAFLFVESDAAGGYGEIVTGFVLSLEPPEVRPLESEEPPARAEDLCRAERRVSSRVSPSNGLRLRMTRKEVIKRLGRATSETASSLIYLWQGPIVQHGGSSEPSQDTAELRVELNADRVTRIDVERSDLL